MTTIQNKILDPSQRERDLGAIISAYNDVTDRLKDSHDRLTREVKRLRGQIEKKDRELARQERLAALGEMAAGVAHEIRNPLAGIQLCATMLEQDLADQPEAHKLAMQIAQGVRMLDSIVCDILTFAGPDASRFEDVQLSAIVDSSLRTMAMTPDADRTLIQVDRGIDAFVVRADARLMERALVNLLFNAVEAAGPDGSVRVFANAAGEGSCVLSVSDTGPGIASDMADRIFNPFFTTKDNGTGLGLSIVHRIVDAHGGYIRALPAHGGGTEFQLTLTLATNQTSKSEV